MHGALKRQWLIHLVTAWIGEGGDLRKFSCRYRAVDYPRPMKTTGEPEDGETWWCKGKVTRKYVQADEHFVDCEVWVENSGGEISTSGKASVVLPARGSTGGSIHNGTRDGGSPVCSITSRRTGSWQTGLKAEWRL